MFRGNVVVLLLLLSLPLAEAGMLNLTHHDTEGYEGNKLKARFRYHDELNNSIQEKIDKVSTILYCEEVTPTAYETIVHPIKDDLTDEYLIGVRVPKETIKKEKSKITCSMHLEAGSDSAFIENITIKRSWKSIPARIAQWIEDGWKALKDAFSGRRAVE